MIKIKDNPLMNCDLKLDSSAGRFTGYASVFDGNDTYNDTIKQGAFSEGLKNAPRLPLMLFGHNPYKVMGKYINISEDEKGLVVEGEFTPNNSDASNVYASMVHGAIDGLSIGFRIPKNGATEKEGGGLLIEKVDLMEISIVTFPADLDARVAAVISDIETIESLRECELFLRESEKFTKSTAQLLIVKVKELIRREADIKSGALVDKLERQLHSDNNTQRLIDIIHKM